MIGGLLRVITAEPVVTGGFVSALLAVAVAFGTDLSPEQLATLTAVVVAAVTLLQRSAVTPVARQEREPFL